MPTDIDRYLATISEPARSALENLRQIIKSVVPDATEVISYQIPSFKYRGSDVGGLQYHQRRLHVPLAEQLGVGGTSADVKGYKTGKGSIRYAADQPLPAALVNKLVRARIAENEAR